MPGRPYTPTSWVDVPEGSPPGGAPALSAANLNHIEQAIDQLDIDLGAAELTLSTLLSGDLTARPGAWDQVRIGAVGPSSKPGISFGLTPDTILYFDPNSGCVRLTEGTPTYGAGLVVEAGWITGLGTLDLYGNLSSTYGMSVATDGSVTAALGATHQTKIGNVGPSGQAGFKFGASGPSIYQLAGSWLTVAATLSIDSPGTHAIEIYNDPEGENRMHVGMDGKLEWGDGINPVNVNLYWGAANVLKTDDAFQAVGRIYALVGQSGQAVIGAGGPSGQAGIAFGAAQDAAIYYTGTAAMATTGSLALGDGSTAVTQALADNTTKIATTAWVKAQGYGGGGSGYPGSYPIINADISASAAIAYSKLNLASSIVNADISASAAIAYSKLNLGSSIVNADISASAAIAYSKLNLGSSIVNADINASAAIAWTKISKTGSSLADLATRSASDLSSGTIPAARLPVFVASGASHAIGAVPDPGASAGTTKFLREDATWVVPSTSVPDPLTLTSDITARNTLSTQVKIGAVGPSSQAGILFGVTNPANLYLSAADTLKTDDALIVAGNLTTLGMGLWGTGSGMEQWIRSWDSAGARLVEGFNGTIAAARQWQIYVNGTNAAPSHTFYSNGNLQIVGSYGGASGAVTNWLAVNQGDLTPGGGQGAIFFNSSWGARLYANVGSPSYVSTDKSPPGGDNTTKLATTAWVLANAPSAAENYIYLKSDYGAVGDGVANDTTAVNNALAQARTDGRTVFAEPGIYKGNFSTLGDCAILGVKGKISNESDGTVFTQASGAVFTISGAQNLEIEKVQIYNVDANAVLSTNTVGSPCANITFRDVLFTNFGSGDTCYFNPASGEGNERIVWDNCRFHGGGINQFHIHAKGDFFDKCVVESNTVFDDFQGYAVRIQTIAVRSFAMRDTVAHGLAGQGCRGMLYLDCSSFAYSVVLDRSYTENAGDRGTTADITHQGDIVLKGAQSYVTFIGGMLNSPGGTPGGSANYLNIQSTSGAIKKVNTNTWGSLVNPNGITVTNV
jgi:hypothetical protein